MARIYARPPPPPATSTPSATLGPQKNRQTRSRLHRIATILPHSPRLHACKYPSPIMLCEPRLHSLLSPPHFMSYICHLRSCYRVCSSLSFHFLFLFLFPRSSLTLFFIQYMIATPLALYKARVSVFHLFSRVSICLHCFNLFVGSNCGDSSLERAAGFNLSPLISNLLRPSSLPLIIQFRFFTESRLPQL